MFEGMLTFVMQEGNVCEECYKNQLQKRKELHIFSKTFCVFSGGFVLQNVHVFSLGLYFATKLV